MLFLLTSGKRERPDTCRSPSDRYRTRAGNAKIVFSNLRSNSKYMAAAILFFFIRLLGKVALKLRNEPFGVAGIANTHCRQKHT